MSATNYGDVYITLRPETVGFEMGHPAPGRREALLTYREAKSLGEYLTRLAPPAAVEDKGGIFG